MTELKFVIVSGNMDAHPHKGALDENGKPGYIHDDKALRKDAPPFTFSKDAVNCNNTSDCTRQMLTQKVYVDLDAHKRAEELALNGSKPRVKLFCLVYTTEINHHRIPVIRETWGKKCDGFMVGSNKTDKAIGTVNVPHEGPETYHTIWLKVRSLWSYVYDNYYEEYDWFHIGGDDMYLLVENLRLYLESEEISLAANGGKYLPSDNVKPLKQLPLYLGCRFKQRGNRHKLFNTGGSGYTLNKAALKALVMEFPSCYPHTRTAKEDVHVAKCFRERLGVFPFDTKDEDGGERYMHLQPEFHLKSEHKFSLDVKKGLGHCAARSVAFHYIDEKLMKRMHAILYRHCNKK